MTELEMEIQRLRRENSELLQMHQLELAEIIRLRRMIEAIVEDSERSGEHAS